MEKPPNDYVIAESVFDFVDVSPYVYEEGYSPYYGMVFYLWDNDACDTSNM